jgi:hypothetical protein
MAVNMAYGRKSWKWPRPETVSGRISCGCLTFRASSARVLAYFFHPWLWQICYRAKFLYVADICDRYLSHICDRYLLHKCDRYLPHNYDRYVMGPNSYMSQICDRYFSTYILQISYRTVTYICHISVSLVKFR